MPLNPDVAELLDKLATTNAPPLSAGTPEAARAGYDAAPKPVGDAMAEVADRTIPRSSAVGEIPIRVYRPTPGNDALPVVMFFHGGGWVLSSVEGHDGLARRLAARGQCLVVSVDYRLAPEHPFPAPHDDCWEATQWVAKNAGQIGADPTKMAVAGDSAGGNLAAGIALRARDEALPLIFQLLIYPCIDTDFTRPSMIENGEDYFLERTDMEWFWNQYVPADHWENPYAVPMRATDVSGLPPALIQVAGYDPLRDEGAAWGNRLIAAGVDVVVTNYEGQIHGFASRWDQIPSAVHSHDEAGKALRAALGT